tara:strand:- start:501 stop:2651 length:2151 start_codon:yes stop_codon:yes gene_type:complete
MSVSYSTKKPTSSEGIAGDLVIYESPSAGYYLYARGKRSWKQTSKLRNISSNIKLSNTVFDSFLMKGNINLNGYNLTGNNTLNNQGITIDKGSNRVSILSSQGLVVNHNLYLAKANYSKIYLDGISGDDYIASTANKVDIHAGGVGIFRIQNDTTDGVTLPIGNKIIFSGLDLGSTMGNSSDDGYYIGRSGTSGAAGTTLQAHVADTNAITIAASYMDLVPDNYELRFNDGSYHTGFKAHATMTANAMYTLPAAYPASNKILQSDSSGNLTWASDTNTITALNSATENELVTVGATTTELDAEANLTFDGSTLTVIGSTTIDKNTLNTTTANNTAFYIDYDQTGIVASGQTVRNIGINLDMNGDSVTHVGTHIQTGIDIDLVGATAGTQENKGISIDVDGADTNTGLEINTAGTHIKLIANADTDDYATFTLADTGDLTIATTGDGTTDSNLTLDTDGDIELNADGGDVTFKDASASISRIANDSGSLFQLYNINDTGDFLRIVTGSRGDTTISTVDGSGSSSGHITLDPNGDLIVSGADTKIDAAKKIFLDGGTHTYITESADDVLDVVVGGQMPIRIIESANECITLFRGSAAGFTQSTTTYNATDTDVNFRITNKSIVTFGSGDITDIQLYFPSGSGNFVLLLKQDGTGSRTVTNWKAYDTEGNAAAGSSTVVWAGGSAPTLTTDANHVDILSFYWDDSNEIAYGVATLDFQF